ncbi:hypothetical protein RHGRI_037925 [Rhododendron griersonianum]|uniref:F-box domain-containing protein n=1 Tax=Rhododendron griersonianum TaxID=479676 RepID=A0AAV6HU43_9ERIC|nr:hypothetical protein RHGRI_037925 [Rhododendron griersonianum]
MERMEKSLEVTAMEEEEENHPIKKLERYREDDCHCDPFRKLPDEVLGLILLRLSDPESLLRCSLVSKHFALFRSQSFSLRLRASHLIPWHLLPPHQYPNPFDALPPPHLIPRHLLPPQFPNPFDAFFNATRLLGLTKLVSRFTSLRSLHIQLSCECPQLPFAPIYRFSCDFKVGHDKPNTFTILSKTSINNKIDEVGGEPEHSWLDENYLNWQTTCSVRYANSIYPLLLLLVPQHPHIDSVEIMDSEKHGKVSLQGEQLIKLKNNMSKWMPPPPNILEPRRNSDLVPGYFFTVWCVPELRLPRSGLVMKGVTLGVGAENMFPSNVDDGTTKGLANDFGDGVFGEALAEILTNYYVTGRKINLRLSSRKP